MSTETLSKQASESEHRLEELRLELVRKIADLVAMKRAGRPRFPVLRYFARPHRQLRGQEYTSPTLA